MPNTDSVSSPSMGRVRKARARTPMYQVLKADLEAEIRKGNLKPGDLVPSESELIARYRVSSTTARRCLDELESEGLLERRRGRGTYVSGLARMLNKQRIAVVVKDLFSLTHPFLATVVGTLEKAMESEGARVMIVRAHFGEDGESSEQLLEMLVHEGIQFAFLLSNLPLRMVKPLLDNGIRCLGVNTRYVDPRIPHICINFAEGFFVRLTEVARRGHRRFAILTQESPMAELGVRNSSSFIVDTYAEVRRDFPDLPEEPLICQVANLEDVEGVVKKLLKEMPDLTAFVCWDELAGLEVLRVLKALGRGVPEEFSIVGMRLLPVSPIACLENPLTEIARLSAEAMLGWMKGIQPENVLISSKTFLPRETIAPAR